MFREWVDTTRKMDESKRLPSIWYKKTLRELSLSSSSYCTSWWWRSIWSDFLTVVAPFTLPSPPQSQSPGLHQAFASRLYVVASSRWDFCFTCHSQVVIIGNGNPPHINIFCKLLLHLSVISSCDANHCVLNRVSRYGRKRIVFAECIGSSCTWHY